MRFKRILYFLLVQGPLERASGVLQLELKVLTHYVGPYQKDCGCGPPRMGRMAEEEAFPNEDQVQTMKFVPQQIVSRRNVSLSSNISHGKTCESILEKVYRAEEF